MALIKPFKMAIDWYRSCHAINILETHWGRWRYMAVEDHGQPLQWRHNEHVSVSNHQPHDCLLNRLFGRRSKKTPKLRITGVLGIHRGPVNSPHKGQVTRKMFPFDDAIIIASGNGLLPQGINQFAEPTLIRHSCLLKPVEGKPSILSGCAPKLLSFMAGSDDDFIMLSNTR